jgi:hypothetical protein
MVRPPMRGVKDPKHPAEGCCHSGATWPGGPVTVLTRIVGTAPDQAYAFERLDDPDLRRLDGYGLSRTNRLTVISLPVKNLVSGG